MMMKLKVEFVLNLDHFRYIDIKVGSEIIKGIFKNGYNRETNSHGKHVPYETEIFKDGLAPMLKSSLIAQTFGAPAPT